MIFVRGEESRVYRLIDYFGLPTGNLNEGLENVLSQSRVARYFGSHNDILNVERASDFSKELPGDFIAWVKIIKTRIIIPLVIDTSYFALLILGKKKSDQEYTNDEIDYFPAIASQTSLAIRNALLFETVLREREEKLKAQDEAKRVHYAEILAHEVKNAVTAADLQARSLYEQVEPRFRLFQEKFMKDLIPNGAIKQFEKMCQKLIEIGHGIQDRARKIRIITKTAQHHLSSDESAAEEIYVKMLWEDAILDSGVKGVNFQYQGPKDKDFYVYGNPVLLQRVFTNLIKNADDAMGEKQDKKIVLECDYGEAEGRQAACFKFTDNGPGILPENLEKIFEKGFSTKPKPASGDLLALGSGYGLFACREIIGTFHHGKIWAERGTEEGGAVFKFWLPSKPETVDNIPDGPKGPSCKIES
ncbi:MAG: ATP-binding protein [Candidatus Omnitrophica bacterium]|nr:ATP-binding protein [Candidatus Omnitrophota bacterium]